MNLTNKHIAIVGGGPGGLTLARLLQMNGLNVKVYERDFDKNARVQGSPLDMHEESGLRALRMAGLLETFKKKFRAGADKKLIMNAEGKIIFSDHDTNIEENFGNPYFRPEIDRGPLRALLLESLSPDSIQWDSHFIAMEKQNEGWMLHFKNGTNAYADLVIAADGANSKIRPYITDQKPFYSGITMLEANVYNSRHNAPHLHSLLKGGKIMAFGNSQCLLMGSKGSNDLGYYASFKTDENWATNSGLDFSNKQQIMDWFKKEFKNWDNSWDELFENVDTPFVPRPIYCMPLNQGWEAQPNITMIGDAAHVMPPFAGEGANMAMLDAVELSLCLTNHSFKTLKDAISAYETEMRKRAAEASKESLDNGEMMHSENALNGMLAIFNGH